MVDRRIVRTILLREVHMLHLSLSRRDALLIAVSLFLRCWPCGNAIRPTVEARPIVVDDGGVVDDGVVDVGIVNDGSVHVHYGRVVGKRTATPFTASKTDSAVTETVIYAAVKPNVEAPVAGVKDIHAACTPTPVARRPEIAGLWSQNPGAGHPVVAKIPPCPVAGCPDVVGCRTYRLHINRKHRRGDVD